MIEASRSSTGLDAERFVLLLAFAGLVLPPASASLVNSSDRTLITSVAPVLLDSSSHGTSVPQDVACTAVHLYDVEDHCSPQTATGCPGR